MRHETKFSYDEQDEFIDDILYFHEKYGDEFVCDGDLKVVTVTYHRGFN